MLLLACKHTCLCVRARRFCKIVCLAKVVNRVHMNCSGFGALLSVCENLVARAQATSSSTAAAPPEDGLHAEHLQAEVGSDWLWAALGPITLTRTCSSGAGQQWGSSAPRANRLMPLLNPCELRPTQWCGLGCSNLTRKALPDPVRSRRPEAPLALGLGQLAFDRPIGFGFREAFARACVSWRWDGRAQSAQCL